MQRVSFILNWFNNYTYWVQSTNSCAHTHTFPASNRCSFHFYSSSFSLYLSSNLHCQNWNGDIQRIWDLLTTPSHAMIYHKEYNFGSAMEHKRKRDIKSTRLLFLSIWLCADCGCCIWCNRYIFATTELWVYSSHSI